MGHRVVHGGPHFHHPVRISNEVHAAIGGLSHFAPLHIQSELEGINVVADLLGDVPQFAVFDTGFHRHMPVVSQTYPGPYEWFEHGIRRYGFHGINHQYCATRTAQLIRRDLKSLKIVCCHLGNGCSVTGIRGGRSVDTTMGFTPLDGLMMGTRSGSVDPGILTFLMRQDGLDADQIDDMLNKNRVCSVFLACQAICATFWLESTEEMKGRSWLSIFTFTVCEPPLEEWRLFWKAWMFWCSRLE